MPILSHIICSANGNTSFTFIIRSSSLRRSLLIFHLFFFMERLMENSATIRLSSYLYFFKARSTFKIFLGSSNVIPFTGSGLLGLETISDTRQWFPVIEAQSASA
jgi:hypothetical protein